jgi:hypothetical protein
MIRRYQTLLHLPGQTFEEFAHSAEIQLVRTVENYALNREGLREILCGLCLTSTCRTGWCTTKFQM